MRGAPCKIRRDISAWTPACCALICCRAVWEMVSPWKQLSSSRMMTLTSWSSESGVSGSITCAVLSFCPKDMSSVCVSAGRTRPAASAWPALVVEGSQVRIIANTSSHEQSLFMSKPSFFSYFGSRPRSILLLCAILYCTFSHFSTHFLKNIKKKKRGDGFARKRTPQLRRRPVRSCASCVLPGVLATGAILRRGFGSCFLRFPNQKLPDTG